MQSDYFLQVWDCLGRVLSDKLQKLQNRAFRIITRESNEIPSADIMDNAVISNLKARRKHQLALLMFKVKNKMLPNHLNNTRNSEFNFALPKAKTNNIHGKGFCLQEG
jgi:hypothetical protein